MTGPINTALARHDHHPNILALLVLSSCAAATNEQSNADMRAARIRQAELEREEEAAWYRQQASLSQRCS